MYVPVGSTSKCSSSSVRRIRPRAPRAKRSAAIPKRAATGIAQTASSSLTPVVWREMRTATGTAAMARSPESTASDERWLLLRIRPSCGGGRDRPADHARDRDQGQGVRQRLEQHGVRAPVRDRPESLRERAREAEQQRRTECAGGPPLAEDECSEGDEAAPLCHVLVERVHEAD